MTTSSTMTNGLVTGTKVRVLGTDQWLTTTSYYDSKGRPVQAISDNLQGGLVVTSSLYDFAGKVLSSYTHLTNPRSGIAPDEQILTILTYDDHNHVTKVTKQVNGTTPVIVSQNTYDELGRLKKKVLGNNLEVLNNEYTIKGWLSSINKDYITGTNTEANHFGEKLGYDAGFTIPQYNGNIAGVTWKGFNAPIARDYGYAYDATNRITRADFGQQNDGSTAYTNDKVDFTVSAITYDENGNILTMNQNGLKAAHSTALDQLHYKTVDNSNKLQYVWDGISDPTSTLGDFHEPAANKTANQNSNTADYTYDNNGNLTVDNNKAITAIAYNYLNLPQQITITAKGTIQYVYDAGGNKLRKIVTDNTVHPSKVTTTDYVSGMVYQNDTLQFIPHEEGRVRLVLKTGQAPQYVFDYFIKDHLGNIREVLTTETSTAQYAATLETGNSAVENALFSNIDNTRTSLPTGYPADGTTNPNAYAAKLNAQSGQKTGPSLVLRVMAGDMITIGAKAYYTNTGANTRYASTADMITSLLQAFATGGQADGAHVPTGSSSPMSSTTMNSSVFDQIKQTPGSEDNASKPKAYLNFVLFDDQFNMVSSNSGNRQVQASPGALQTLAVSAMTIKSTGFIYIYVSNESGQDVYFDNLVVNHTSGPLLEETHYYPFGLTMAGISSHALLKLDNRYKYNGKELQSEEFADGNGLEEYDYGARFYDPAVGRFTSMDPLSEKMRRHSPYNYAFDNPIRFIDIDGMSPGDFYNKNGDHLGSDGNADQKKYVVADEQEAKQVAQTDKEKGTTQVSNLKSAVGLPSDKVLAAALDVLKRATSNGGQKEEASIVNRNGYVAESVTGPEPTIENGVQTAPDVLPKVWPGDPASAVQATIHSHPVKPLVDGDRVYGQSANNPSQQDLTTFSQFNLNIIVGPLGVLENVTKNERGEIQGTYRPNGVVLYNSNGKEQVSLTEKAVNKIVSH